MGRTVSTIGDLDDMLGIAAPPRDGPAPRDITTTKSAPSQPGAVTPKAAAWTKDGLYILQRGDTLWGVARTYLKVGTRWKEIWALQSDAYKSAGCGPFPKRSPDKVCEGDLLFMPEEAKSRARELGVLGMMSGRGGSTKLIIGGVAVVGAGLLSYVYAANQ